MNHINQCLLAAWSVQISKSPAVLAGDGQSTLARVVRLTTRRALIIPGSGRRLQLQTPGMTSEDLREEKEKLNEVGISLLQILQYYNKHISKIDARLEMRLVLFLGDKIFFSPPYMQLGQQINLSKYLSLSGILRAAMHLSWHRILHMHYWPTKSKEG